MHDGSPITPTAVIDTEFLTNTLVKLAIESIYYSIWLCALCRRDLLKSGIGREIFSRIKNSNEKKNIDQTKVIIGHTKLKKRQNSVTIRF